MKKPGKAATPSPAPTASRRILLAAGALLFAVVGGWLVLGDSTPARAEQVVVKLSPWCGCCGGWVDHMRQAGFTVEVIETEEMEAVKQGVAVPEALWSCHTAEIASYVVEGHVPLSAIDKLLDERPIVDGIALAGMPPGSPGMGGTPWSTYPVDAFRDGAVATRFMDAPLR